VSQGGAFEARVELFCNRGAAGLIAALQYQGLKACARQIKSGDQPVVTRAKNDDVVGHN
jgi:hypothetical protein